MPRFELISEEVEQRISFGENFYAAGGEIQLSLVNEDGGVLPNTVTYHQYSPMPIEHTDGKGNFQMSEIRKPPLIDISGEIPENSRIMFTTNYNAGEIGFADVRATSDLVWSTEGFVTDFYPTEIIPEPITITLISERFGQNDLNRFREACVSLYNNWSARPPFSSASLAGRLKMKRVFAPCDDTGKGHFRTADAKIAKLGNGRLHGDNSLAKAFLKQLNLQHDFNIVLINSTKRAGAGGLADGSPAWSTISSGEHEQWESVCLHEFGHGLGLIDEYETPWDKAPPYDQREPNVSSSPICAQTNWSALCGDPQTVLASGQFLVPWTMPISSIQGARYDQNLAQKFYRPAQNCLMRSTNAQFCGVCANHIAHRLLGPGG